MKKGKLFGLIVSLFIFTCVNISFADTIHLKSGDKINGNIIASSDKSIMVETQSGEYITCDPENVEKIEKNVTARTKINKQEKRVQKKSEIVDNTPIYW